jgi:hypothetical protein
MSQTQLKIHFGALSDPIKEQVNAQGLSIHEGRAEAFQEYAKAITYLWMGDLITDSMKESAQKKLFRKIANAVRDEMKARKQ